MNAYTKAIEIFEEEAVKIGKAHRAVPPASDYISALAKIEARDADMERCQWAIETIQAAYVAERDAVLHSVTLKREQNYLIPA